MQGAGFVETVLGMADQFGNDPRHGGIAAPRQDVRGVQAMAGQDIAWQVALTAGAMQRQRAQEAREPWATPANPAAQRCGPLPAGQNQRRHLDERRGGLAEIAFQVAQSRHGIVIEIAASRLDHVGKTRLWQPAGRDGQCQFLGHGMGGCLAGEDGGNDVRHQVRRISPSCGSDTISRTLESSILKA